mmetsp:Transcript_58601/g.181564  ORF Transcript_58601/g.181564 Transcript_58601/m.181564 type:complete len:298 (+) Transcript_58601:92-985(+)
MAARGAAAKGRGSSRQRTGRGRSGGRAAAVTLASADLGSESDPEDADYEEDASSAEEAGGAKGEDQQLEAEAPGAEGRRCAIDALWAEMHAEAMAAAAKRPPCAPQDALARQFQRRHPRPPKDCSRRGVLAQLARYSCAVPADAPPPKPIAELKKQVRGAATVARATAAAAPVRPQPAARVVETTVRFAGENVTVRRKVPGSGAGAAPTRKRRKTEDLGGQLAAVDALLSSLQAPREVSALEKSNMDWNVHKDEAGLDDLQRDPHAGALERRDFLARASERSEAVARAAMKQRRGAS